MGTEKKKILEILDQSKGYETALFTTFNFEIDFFEKAVLSRLFRNGIKKISVFVDAKELAKAVAPQTYCVLGKRYAVNPVVMHGSFHPKLILLLGEKKARLIVSSANLKLSGYFINNEVFTSVDYSADRPEFRDVICAAIDFFVSLHHYQTCTYRLDSDLLDSLSSYRYYREAPANNRLYLIHNMDQSVLSQVCSVIKDPVRKIRVAVPYYDNDLGALREIRDIYPEAEIQLHVQYQKSTFPESVFRTDPCAKAVRVFNEMTVSGGKNSRFYHGKVFLFQTESQSFVLYGSSNCTRSALVNSMENGNVECNILACGGVNEFDSYFEHFEDFEADSVESHMMTFESQPDNNFYFMYGQLNKELELHIGCKKLYSDITVTIFGIEVDYTVKEGHLIVYADPSLMEGIFDISIRYDGGEEIVRAWYNDVRALELFRLENEDNISIVDREDYAIGDKFKEEYEKLLKGELTCAEDLDVWENRVAPLLKASDGIEGDAAEATEEDDLIVNVEISDEDYAAVQKYRIVEHIRGRIRSRYMSGLEIPAFYHGDGKHHKKELENDSEERVVRKRKATTEEKRFERFVKGRAKRMLESRFSDRISTEHFYGLTTIIFEIIEKNRDRDELIEDIFLDSYVIPTRIAFLIKLIEKSELDDSVVTLTLEKILDNHVRISQMQTDDEKNTFELQNRKLLNALEEKYKLRDNYEEKLLLLHNGVFTLDAQERYNGARRYLESLYGYKSLDQIREYISRRYGDESSIELMKQVVRIQIHTETPGDYIRPDDVLVSELFKYSINVEKVSTIRIVIINDNVADRKAIVKIEHVISLNYHKKTTTIFRANGMKDEGRPQFYNFH